MTVIFSYCDYYCSSRILLPKPLNDLRHFYIQVDKRLEVDGIKD